MLSLVCWGSDQGCNDKSIIWPSSYPVFCSLPHYTVFWRLIFQGRRHRRECNRGQVQLLPTKAPTLKLCRNFYIFLRIAHCRCQSKHNNNAAVLSGGQFFSLSTNHLMNYLVFELIAKKPFRFECKSVRSYFQPLNPSRRHDLPPSVDDMTNNFP